MTRCASCGAEEELLFTCSHCSKQFCATHQFPHHACDRFTTDDGGPVGFEFGDGTVIADDPAGVTDGTTDGPEAAGEDDGTRVPGPRVEVARDAARETRPDRDGGDDLPPNRGMPWERGPNSVLEWMEEQSYPTYLAKVGGLSLLLTAAYYAGLAATLYGYV
ncbi:AN1-type zinc finger protein [Halorarius halobius]|uniref:AN1-type zinc finger protein n=1 Tax=Halorarius halobius TaxID=2962671 RepID=UPI0020CBEDB7|nr:AN1-type zinc finger protein [Halorarius halobius]